MISKLCPTHDCPPLDEDNSINDLNKGQSDALEDNLEQNNDTAKQLEAEKARLLEEAREELRKEQHSQNQVLEIARRLAQLQGQDPDKGESHSRIWVLHLFSLYLFHPPQILSGEANDWIRAVIVDAVKQIKFITFVLLHAVTLRDLQRPDSDEETEEEAALRLIKQVGDQSQFNLTVFTGTNVDL